ncbi:hypothetical protein [Candidatus Phytoplasma fraxini]|uniref:Transmembrane protein n=1 Tax=Ash yellows phytoplasma TaxID=35780 RepID=A0ABZ2UB89_ASHYP
MTKNSNLGQNSISSIYLLVFLIIFSFVWRLFYILSQQILEKIFYKQYIIIKCKICLEKIRNIKENTKKFNKLKNRKILLNLLSKDIQKYNHSLNKPLKDKHYKNLEKIIFDIYEFFFGNYYPYERFTDEIKSIKISQPDLAKIEHYLNGVLSSIRNGHIIYYLNASDYDPFFNHDPFFNYQKLEDNLKYHRNYIKYLSFYINILENCFCTFIDNHSQQLQKIKSQLLQKQKKSKFIFLYFKKKIHFITKKFCLFLKKSILQKIISLIMTIASYIHFSDYKLFKYIISFIV